MNNSKPKITPLLPRGMRDLLPDQLAVRYKVIETLRRVFELYGFQPLETPAMERLEILSGKGGEESDKLSFLVMKRGAEFQRALDKIIATNNAGELNYGEAQKELADMGLRYDLTVPLARVVAMNQGKLPMPFKRYQIAPVWRAERPQHGRYREFTQCDVDIVGTDSPVADAEIIALLFDGFEAIGNSLRTEQWKIWDIIVLVNHREILSQLSLASGNSPDLFSIFCAILDKLDKIGVAAVLKEMQEKGLSTNGLGEILGRRENHLIEFSEIWKFISNAIGSQVNDVAFQQLFEMKRKFPGKPLIIDYTLARGLDYYTGMICEVATPTRNIGSLGGGGRYDGLVASFSKQSFPAVGVSFGIERIVDLLCEEYVPTRTHPVTTIIKSFSNIGTRADLDALGPIDFRIATFLRDNGLSCDLTYPHNEELGRQLKWADRIGRKFVIIIDDEYWIKYDAIFSILSFDTIPIQIKRLSDGDQRRLTLPQIVKWIKESKG